MKYPIALLLILFSFSVSADEPVDDLQRPLEIYNQSLQSHEFQLNKIGEFCSIIFTNGDVDDPTIMTFDCQRFVAGSFADMSVVKNLARLFDEHIAGELSDKEVLNKIYILLRLRIEAQKVYDANNGELK